MHLLKLAYLFITTALFFLICGYGCNTNETYYLSQGEIFHTTYHIKYKYHKPLDNDIVRQLQLFNASLNPFDSTSVISKINRNEPVKIDSFFLTVFNKAQDVSAQTSGAFDITCAPLINLWGFGFQHSDNVTPEIIDSLKMFVGYNKIKLKDEKIIKEDSRITLNCSAIAKGYATDIIANLLESYGIADYMVEIGGEVRGKGINPKGTCWKIEIPQPIDDHTGSITKQQEIIDLCDRSIATSGNYRNYYIKDGKKYAHTIHPKIGYPAESDMLSASIICKDCMTADAYATACMTLGVDSSLQLLNHLRTAGHEILDYYFIYTDNEGKMQVKTSLKAESEK